MDTDTNTGADKDMSMGIDMNYKHGTVMDTTIVPPSVNVTLYF
jgi:hypothetical protein